MTYRRFRPASELQPVGEALSDFMTVARFTTDEVITRAYYISTLDNIGQRVPDPSENHEYLALLPVLDEVEEQVLSQGGILRKFVWDEDYEVRHFEVALSPVTPGTTWRGVIRNRAGFLMGASEWMDIESAGLTIREFVLEESVFVFAGVPVFIGIESDISTNELALIENDYPSIVPGSQDNEDSDAYRYLPTSGWENDDLLLQSEEATVRRVDPIDGNTYLWSGAPGSRIHRMRVTETAKVLIADNGGDVYQLDAMDGSQDWVYQSPNHTQYGLLVESDGSAIYTCGMSGRIARVNSDGNEAWEIDIADHPSYLGSTALYGIAMDADYLYVYAANAGVYQIGKEGGAFGWTRAGESLGNSSGQNIVMSPEGKVLIFDQEDGNDCVRTINPETGISEGVWLIPEGAGNRQQLGITPNDHLLVITIHDFYLLDPDDFSLIWSRRWTSYTSSLPGHPGFAPGGDSFYLVGNDNTSGLLHRLTKFSLADGSQLWQSNQSISGNGYAVATLVTEVNNLWELVAEHQIPMRVHRHIDFDPLTDNGQLLGHRYWPSYIELHDVEIPLRGLVPTWEVAQGQHRQMDLQVQEREKDPFLDDWMSLESSTRNQIIAEEGLRVRAAISPADIIDSGGDEGRLTPSDHPFPTDVCGTQWRDDDPVGTWTPPNVWYDSNLGRYGLSGLGTNNGRPSNFHLDEGIADQSGDMEAVLRMASTNSSTYFIFTARRIRHGNGTGVGVRWAVGSSYYAYIIRHDGGTSTNTLEDGVPFSSVNPWAYNTGYYRCRMVWSGNRICAFVNDRFVLDYSGDELNVPGTDVGVYDNYGTTTLCALFDLRIRGAAPGEPGAADQVMLDHVAAFYDRLAIESE